MKKSKHGQSPKGAQILRARKEEQRNLLRKEEQVERPHKTGIDMERRFGPGGSDEQVREILQGVVDNLGLDHTIPSINVMEMMSKAQRLAELKGFGGCQDA